MPVNICNGVKFGGKHKFKQVSPGRYKCERCSQFWWDIGYHVRLATTNPNVFLYVEQVDNFHEDQNGHLQNLRIGERV